jgi:hypothetical protein
LKSSQRSRTGLMLILLVLLALLARVAYISTLEPEIFWYDGQEYQRLARGIMDQGAYLAEDGSPTAFWPPGYPAFLAILGADVLLVRVVQALLGSLAVFLIFLLARRFLGHRQSLLAAALSAIYPLYIYTAGSFYPVALLTVLLTSVFILLLQSVEKGGRFRAILAGLLGGFASLTTAAALPAMALTIPWLWFEGNRNARGRGRGLSIVFALMLVLVVGGWTARNVSHFGRPVLVSLNGGYNFWLGNYPGVKATTGNRWTDQMQTEYHTLAAQNPGEAELDAALRSRAWEFIRKDPLRFVGLSAAKGLNLWRLYPQPMTEDRPGLNAEKLISICSYGLALPFALFFLFISLRKWPGARLALIFFLAYTAVHAVVLSKFRFRLPLDGILLVFTAGGLGMLMKTFGWKILEDPKR